MRRAIRMFGGAVVATATAVTVTIGTTAIAGATTTPPTVVSFTASRTSLPYTGGTVVVKVTVKNASTCKLTSIPAITLPSKFACKKGTYSKTITIPRDTKGQPAGYSIGMTVANSAGTEFATAIAIEVGAAPPPLSMSPAILSFGDQGVLIQSAPILVTVRNNSTSPQQITAIGIDSGYLDYSDFGVLNNSCTTVTAGRTCTFDVDFVPSGSGSRSTYVDIDDSTFGNSAQYLVEGTGVFAAVTPAASGLTATKTGSALSFGDVGVDTGGEPVNLTLENSGTVPLDIGLITTVGTNTRDFDVTNAGNCEYLVIGLDQTCTISITFNPTSSGPRTTDVVIDDNASNFETFVTLNGTGVYATTTYTIGSATSTPGQPVSYDFGTANDGSTVGPIQVTVTNTSTTIAAYFGSASMQGTRPADFSVTPGSCVGGGYMLNALASCTFSISFTPSVVGAETAYWTLSDNTANGSDVLNFSGTGTAG